MNSNEQTTETLQTLNDLISALSEGERTTYNHIMHNSNFQPKDFEKYASWSDECYTRNCIIDNEEFELILICWCAGHKTPIHDHGGEECWVKVIEGTFKETIYKPNETGEMNKVKTSISKANEVTYMKDFMGFHCLENIAKKRSMSLHLYAKPIRACRMFDEHSKTYVNRNLEYDTNASTSIKI
ncbi:MAG: cysteine dioxygenase family protein [Flavobacteriaceae bacterium]